MIMTVPKWHMCTRVLLFHGASTIQIQHKSVKADIVIIISWKLFSPWYSWKNYSAQNTTCYHTKYHMLSHKIPRVITQNTTCYHTKYHMLSHKIPRVITQNTTCYHTNYHMLSHKIPHVITQNTTCYHTKCKTISPFNDVRFVFPSSCL